jgi:hypothetical protein
MQGIEEHLKEHFYGHSRKTRVLVEDPEWYTVPPE